MEFLIITGLSGAGKSRAADVLEDLDYYCVDNMPVALMPRFAELCMATKGRYEKVALVTDVREKDGFDTLLSTLDELKAKVATREMAAAYCDSPLGNYETDPVELKANSSEYMALIVTMPEYVDSVANHHRDAEAPWVKLRVIFTANQQK